MVVVENNTEKSFEAVKTSKDYARGYTDALSHVKGTLFDLVGQMDAVTETILKEAFEEEATKEETKDEQ